MEPIPFTYNNETVLIHPGKRLATNELIVRLNKMKFMVDSSYNRNDLINFYEIALNNKKNRILIFNKLREDTQYFQKFRNSERKNLDGQDHNTTNSNSKIRFSDPLIDKDTNSNADNAELNSSGSSSLVIKILKFLYNHKMDILEKLVYLIIIIGFDEFMNNFARRHFILGKIINQFRNVVSRKRLILGFLFYCIIKYVLDVLFYYLFGFGALTILFLIFKNKIKDLLINI